LHAFGNLPPSAQPDCLRQRPIHPQQAAARAEGHLNPLRRRRAGDRPTMTPTASAKGEGGVNTRASTALCVSHPNRSHHNGKEPVGRVHRVRFQLSAIVPSDRSPQGTPMSPSMPLPPLTSFCAIAREGEGDRKHPKDCECPIHVCSTCSVERFWVRKVDAGVQVAGRRPM
jgi:hypothetical protein